VMFHSWCGRPGGIDGLQGDAIKEYQVHPPTFTFTLQYFLGVRSVVLAMQGSTQSHLKLLFFLEHYCAAGCARCRVQAPNQFALRQRLWSPVDILHDPRQNP
jgi:hypothetical protein